MYSHNSQEPKSTSSSTLSIGVIAGGVAGCVVVIGGVVALTVYLKTRAPVRSITPNLNAVTTMK